MPTRWNSFNIKFEGGLITNLGRIEQGLSAPGSATTLQNMEASLDGGYTKILGYSKFSETALSGTGNVRGVIAVSDTEVLAERGGNFQYSTGTSWTNKLALTSGSISRVRFDRYNFDGDTKIVCVDGVNDPAYFNTTTKAMAYGTSIPTDVTGASYVKVFKNSIFFAKGRLLSFTVPYTDFDFSSGSGGGEINVGDIITGLAVFREQLIIFCLNKILKITGNSSSDFVLSSITDRTGCLNGDTVQEIGGDLLYLGPDGIRYLSATERLDDFGLMRASEHIQTLVSSFIKDFSVLTSVVVPSKNQYRLFGFSSSIVSSGSKGFLGTQVIDQQGNSLSWSTLKGFKVYSIDCYRSPSQEYILFGNDDGYIYRMESTSAFNGDNIESIFETPFMPISDIRMRKTIYKHTLSCKALGVFSVNCQVLFDYSKSGSSPSPVFTVTGSSGVSVYGSAVYGTGVYGITSEEQFMTNTVGSGFVVALRYYDLSTNPPFNLNFVVLDVRQNERK